MILNKEAIFVTLKRVALLNVFIIMVALSAIINEDYNLALLLYLRANAILLFTLLLFYNKDLFDIANATQRLGISAKFSSLLFFVAKFIVIIKEEFSITKKVMKTRNFRVKSNVFSYKIYANVIGVMIVKCFDKAEKLKNSMILRNFQGKIYLTKKEKFTKLDMILFIIIILALSLHVGEIKI